MNSIRSRRRNKNNGPADASRVTNVANGPGGSAITLAEVTTSISDSNPDPNSGQLYTDLDETKMDDHIYQVIECSVLKSIQILKQMGCFHALEVKVNI